MRITYTERSINVIGAPTSISRCSIFDLVSHGSYVTQCHVILTFAAIVLEKPNFFIIQDVNALLTIAEERIFKLSAKALL